MPISNNLKTWARRLLGPLVQNLVKSRVVSGLTWKEKLPLTPIGEFVDSKCRRFERLGGYRDRIVPHWPGMFDDRPKSSTVAKDEIVFARATVEQAEALLKVHGHSFIDAVVLEIGCHGGAHAFSLAGIGAKHVDGIDISDYGIRQSPSKKTDQKTIAEQSSWLSKLRSDVSRHYGEGLSAQTNLCDRIEFHDLDIKDLEKQAVYDVIVSWQTLEHITDPQGALRNMYRALKPGGVSFHEYNPFFCVTGGHSLCTLDFPWGHVRLADSDFDNYISTFRPEEIGVALNFFHKSLNRMTLADLRRGAEKVGFETLVLQTWTDKEDYHSVDHTTLSQCNELYPSLTIGDLASRTVHVLLRKPIH